MRGPAPLSIEGNTKNSGAEGFAFFQRPDWLQRSRWLVSSFTTTRIPSKNTLPSSSTCKPAKKQCKQANVLYKNQPVMLAIIQPSGCIQALDHEALFACLCCKQDKKVVLKKKHYDGTSTGVIKLPLAPPLALGLPPLI